MNNPIITTEEEFDALKPIKNHLDNNASLDGTMFETYGKELDFVIDQPNENIWTYIDVDGVLLLSNGYHLVNRLGYVVTEIPYHGPDTEVVLFDESDEEEYNPLINEG